VKKVMKLLLFVILLLLPACEKKAVIQPVRPVKAIQVSSSLPPGNEIVFPGTLRAYRRADLSFRVDGIVIVRDIKVGHIAKQGEVLIQLDPREYEIALKKAQGTVDSIKAQLDFAERDYERMQNIHKKDPGAISESLLDRKRETINQHKGELIVAEADVNKAADDLSYATLKAPFDGIVSAIYVENHEQVRAKQPVLRFLDIDEGEMEIQVPEKYIKALIEQRTQLNFEVHLDAFPDQIFSASIKEIGTEASKTTLSYPVILSVQNVPIELFILPGMNGKAILRRSETRTEQTFIIPQSAIFTENLNMTYVWIVDPNTQTIHKQEVKIENPTGNCILVQKGLKNGDWVVTAGTSFLSEGQKVKLDKEQSNPCGS
jgi:RND family efflux transporter MFP subunit